MATLVSVGTGLIGTLVGATIAWLAGRRQHRVETTYAMHQEFHAAEMTKSRGLAGKTVRKHYPKNYDDLRRDLPPQKTQHVWNVMYFYQRLWLAIKYENIYTKNVPEMFGGKTFGGDTSRAIRSSLSRRKNPKRRREWKRRRIRV